jgi:gamma-glutamylcyclotransferase (GGCT)/AIG2-like uncharacterized protein YtfP
MKSNLDELNIRVFVFGTLRKGERLAFYMDGGEDKGLYYTRGQLTKAETGSVYIDFKKTDAVTIGELYNVNFFCLQRINHLEAVSTEFPKGYDLGVIPIWKMHKLGEYTFKDEDMTLAFFYRRRNDPVKILSGDYTKHLDPIVQIGKLLGNEKTRKITEDEIIKFVQNILNDVDF